MKGTFYIIGVGPGDPELMTLKAVRILKESPVWFAPAASSEGSSTALTIARGAINGDTKEILTHHFPMKKVHIGQPTEPEVKEAWRQAARIIASHLQQGRDVAFPTLGDPAIYSTSFYVFETLVSELGEISAEIVPGVSAIGATSAATSVPLCLGDERLVVLPATFEDGKLRQMLTTFNCVVLMKVHKVMDRLLPLLEELGLVEGCVLVERTSLQDQIVHRDIRECKGKKLHYFSTMIVRRP